MTANTNETLFVLDDRDGFTVVMTTEATFAQTGDKTPLWYCHLPSYDYLDATLVWIGEHEADWPEWREIAETRGIDAITAHIGGLWAGGIEQAVAVTLTRSDDGRGLTFDVALQSRSVNLLQHQFESREHREAFMTWCFEQVQERSWAVVHSACTRGRANAARLMDAIANDVLSSDAVRRQPRGRRRGRGARDVDRTR